MVKAFVVAMMAAFAVADVSAFGLSMTFGKKAAPAVKKAAPAPKVQPKAPVKKAAPAPPKKVVAAPAKKVVAVKAAPVSSGFSPEEQLGVLPPIGFWDPLGFSTDADEETFKRYRAIEIKHGRVAQLAVLGYFVPEFFRFPGYLSSSAEIKFEDVPNGVAALSKVPVEGIAQILLFQSVIELAYPQKDDKAAGDIAPPGWTRYTDDAVKTDKLNKEINNGRLAMVAITGEIVQNILTGQTPLQVITSGHISPFGDGQGAF